MRIEEVYLGTWFQRTALHLQELHEFLRTGRGIQKGEEKKLLALWRQMAPEHVTLEEDTALHFVHAVCSGIELTMTEDGVLLLRARGKDLASMRKQLEAFYASLLGPAITQLFRRGAPLPKELTEVRETYPLLVVLHDSTFSERRHLLARTRDQMLAEIRAPGLDVLVGNVIQLYDVGERGPQGPALTELLRNMVFFREFERQLSRYLNLHRILWEDIARVRNSKRIRFRDFPAVREQLLHHFETLSFVKARLQQMTDIMEARKASASTSGRRLLEQLGWDRFTQMQAAQTYVSHLWEMTIEYAQGTLTMLTTLYEENTQRELALLKYITLAAAVTGFFGMNIAFPWEERWADTLMYSLGVIAILIAAIIVFSLGLKLIIYNRRFTLREK